MQTFDPCVQALHAEDSYGDPGGGGDNPSLPSYLQVPRMENLKIRVGI